MNAISPARPASLPERIILLEEKAQQCAATRLDVEARLRRIEKALYMLSGALALLDIVLKFIK